MWSSTAESSRSPLIAAMPPPSLRCLLFICAISRSAHETLALNSQLEFLSELPSPRQEHSVAASGNSVYIAGGISSNYSFTPDTLDVPAAVELVGRVQAYDIESDTWTARHPLPRPINHGNIATVDSQIYLLGGLLGENLTEWGGIADSYVYNVDLDTWSSTTPLPDGTARGASAVSVYGENIYLAGGIRTAVFVKAIKTDIVHRYAPTRGRAGRSARFGITCVCIQCAYRYLGLRPSSSARCQRPRRRSCHRPPLLCLRR